MCINPPPVHESNNGTRSVEEGGEGRGAITRSGGGGFICVCFNYTSREEATSWFTALPVNANDGKQDPAQGRAELPEPYGENFTKLGQINSTS